MKYFFLLLIFIPIPLVFSLEYNKKFNIFIYKKKIDYKRKKKGNKKSKIPLKCIKVLWKPKLKLDLDIIYGTDDAALSAILYGIIYSLFPLSFKFINSFFNIKYFNKKVKIDFNNTILYFKLDSILYINIAQIIVNIVFILFLCIKRGDYFGKPSNRQSNEKYNGKS